MSLRLLIFLVWYFSLFSFSNTFAATEDYFNIAALFKESGEYKKALEVLAKARDFGSDPKLRAYLARLFYLNNNSQEAVAIFDTLKQKNWLDFLYLGLIYEDLGKPKQAKTSYLVSLRRGENSIALLRLGKIYRQEGRYRQAAKYFLRLIKLDSSIRLAYYYLGECFYRQARYKEAYKFLAKAINFYPKSEVIVAMLKKVKEYLGGEFFLRKEKEKEQARQSVKLIAYKVQEDISKVRIGLAKGLKQFSFFCGGNFIISDGKHSFEGKSDIFYTIVAKNNKIILGNYFQNTDYQSFSKPVVISSLASGEKKFPFYILDITYGRRNFWQKTMDRAYRGDMQILLRGNKITLINIVDIEEYLYGVLSAEIPHNSTPEVLKAQAVAARTLVFRNRNRHRKEGFDFCADVHCQVYQGLSAETPATTKAVQATRGEILKYAGQPIEAFYHSNCGGCLASDVFGGYDYLANKIDAKEGILPDSAYQQELWFIESPNTFCSSGGSNFRWQRVYDSEDFFIAFGYKLKDLRQIIPKDKGECFRYQKIDVITASGKKVLNGDLEIRNYFDKLRSSAFKLEVKLSAKDKPQMLLFWGAGFGHGTGLCQEGAISMAKEGYSYKEILKHYYPRAKIEKVY